MFIPQDKKFYNIIPDENAVRDNQKSQKTLLLISFVLFFVVFGLSAWSFFVQKSLKETFSSNKTAIERLSNKYSKESIEKALKDGSKISLAKKLLEKHLSLSLFFEFLEKETISSVGYDSLDFRTNEKDSKIQATMQGKSRSYSSVALQNRLLKQNPDSLFESIAFSDLGIDKFGNVLFNLSTFVKKDKILYKLR